MVHQGSDSTNNSRDYTLKVDVAGLEANSEYYFRFKALDALSPTGRTRTMPESEVDEIKLAVVSCSNYEAGYFNAYQQLARKQDVDVVLHLGDYIYEYEPDHYGDNTLERKHLPAKELTTLQDYRTRYSQYRLDPDLNSPGCFLMSHSIDGPEASSIDSKAGSASNKSSAEESKNLKPGRSSPSIKDVAANGILSCNRLHHSSMNGVMRPGGNA